MVALILRCKIYKQTKPVPVAESQLCSNSPAKNIKNIFAKASHRTSKLIMRKICTYPIQYRLGYHKRIESILKIKCPLV